jgi:hypothetical protein
MRIQPETLAAALMRELINERKDWDEGIFAAQLLVTIEEMSGVFVVNRTAKVKMRKEIASFFNSKAVDPKEPITHFEINRLLDRLMECLREGYMEEEGRVGGEE